MNIMAAVNNPKKGGPMSLASEYLQSKFFHFSKYFALSPSFLPAMAIPDALGHLYAVLYAADDPCARYYLYFGDYDGPNAAQSFFWMLFDIHFPGLCWSFVVYDRFWDSFTTVFSLCNNDADLLELKTFPALCGVNNRSDFIALEEEKNGYFFHEHAVNLCNLYRRRHKNEK